jgi:glycine/D-amino acid oxidase-like deaminating enzyme
MQNVRPLSASTLPPDCLSGIGFDSIAIYPDKYLAFLYSRVKELGVRLLHRAFDPSQGFATVIKEVVTLATQSGDDKMNDLHRKESLTAFINCTGLGAKTLCSDTDLYPIRGQTLLVRLHPPPDPSSVRIIMHPASDPDSGGVTYVVPRAGTDLFLLGGTKKNDDWNSEPDTTVTAGILARCTDAWPLLKDAHIDIVNVQVGLRPGRKGGARVEIDKIMLEDGETANVVHQYGHAGAGYQNSIGSARKVLSLVKELLQ